MVHAPSWPGMERDIRALRRAPESFASLGFRQIVDHYERFVLALDEPPILVGHGIGGLVVQALLDRGLGICGVAVASAPIRGIWTLPYTKMRVVTPQLIENAPQPAPGRPDAGTVPLRVHEHLVARGGQPTFERYAVPGPRRVLLQTEFANLNPFAETAINVRRNNRAPLLLIAASQDHLAPPVGGPGQCARLPRFARDHRLPGVPGPHALHHRAERLARSRQLHARLGVRPGTAATT